jgi:hypothetical protein
MDPTKRQLLQQALARTDAHNCVISVGTASGDRLFLRPDFTCYENRVEGTDPEGELVSLTYEEIVSVDVDQQPVKESSGTYQPI